MRDVPHRLNERNLPVDAGHRVGGDAFEHGAVGVGNIRRQLPGLFARSWRQIVSHRASRFAKKFVHGVVSRYCSGPNSLFYALG